MRTARGSEGGRDMMNGSRGIVGPVDGGERVYFQCCPAGVKADVEAGWNVFSFRGQDIRSTSIDRVGNVMIIRSNQDGFWNG